MIAEAGHFALLLAAAVAVLQFALPFWGARRRDAALMSLGETAALAQFALVALSFAALTHAYVSADFSVRNVFDNAHSQMPLIYRYSGVWGNHEGSMLLWVLILALFGALVAAFGKSIPPVLKANTLAVQGLVAFAFLAFVIETSNPFARLIPAPAEGRDLNPILQDIGLAIHPPLLYIGYVGFSIVFAFAAAALIEGRIDAAWAKHVRPWIMFAWVFLTLGIAMGSYWAYYELGWGGFWFWDPVENASLMPWLAGTALLHSALVMEKRGALKIWTILLAILTFSLSLLGTFLVRSGILTSVHSFASDPDRGVFILLILCLFIGGSLALFAWRAPALSAGGLFAPVSREGALVLNNLFLASASAAVLTGTLYPLLLEALTGAKISVGPPFFVMTFIPLMLPLALAMPLGQQLAWKRGDLLGAAQRLMFAFAAGVAAAVIVAAMSGGGPVLAPVGIGIGIYLIIGSFQEVWSRAARGAGSGAVISRLLGLPLAVWGAAIAHAGAGVSVIGVAATAYEVEKIINLKSGERAALGPYEISLEGVFTRSGENYRDRIAKIALRDAAGNAVASLEPAKRIYTARQMPTTEVARYTTGFSQVYLAIGETEESGAVPLRAYWKPYVLLIWLGGAVMAFGGILSLLDRRLRVGAPERAKRRGGAEAAA